MMQTRTKKFAQYRKRILRMPTTSQSGLRMNSSLVDSPESSPVPFVWFIRILVGAVIVLLIVVLALIYFVR
jgi:hypothetical protein